MTIVFLGGLDLELELVSELSFTFHFPICPSMLVHWQEMQTHEVRVTGILDAHNTNAEKTTGSGTEVNVGAVVVVDRGLGAGRC